jgi:hypothetical protein
MARLGHFCTHKKHTSHYRLSNMLVATCITFCSFHSKIYKQIAYHLVLLNFSLFHYHYYIILLATTLLHPWVAHCVVPLLGPLVES